MTSVMRVAIFLLLALVLLGSPFSLRAADRITVGATGINALDLDSIVAEDRGFFSTARLRDRTGVRMEVEEVPHGTIPRFEYKAIRWTDDRHTGLAKVKFTEK